MNGQTYDAAEVVRVARDRGVGTKQPIGYQTYFDNYTEGLNGDNGLYFVVHPFTCSPVIVRPTNLLIFLNFLVIII